MLHKILVVDDDRELQESLKEILSDAGFEAAIASNGEEALDLMKEESFDIVLLDLMMPRMGGMEALSLVRRANPEARIIMITAFATVDNAVSAMRKGASDYISKPFKVDELLITVRRNIEEVKFRSCKTLLDVDGTFNCLANTIRRKILFLIKRESSLRFMDIVRKVGIDDHTKVNFHLKILKDANLVEQDRRKFYALTPEGKKVTDCLGTIVQNLND